jgi:hypothetical protein
MADEDPSASNPAADSPSIPKKETVRITLPPKPEITPMVKRETVRINAPGMAPKKETTSIGGATPLPAATTPTPPPPPATRPLVPPPAPPPRPPSAPGLPGMGVRPPGMPPVAPKPSLPPPSAPKAAPVPAEARPVTIKAAPKKETARIQVSPTAKLPPQATVRLTQPSAQLAAGPAPALRTAAPMAAAEPAGPDTIVTALSWAAVAFSLFAAALSYLAWSA